MKLDTAIGQLDIRNEKEAASAVIDESLVWNLGKAWPTSSHSVWMDDQLLLMVNASGGASGVHDHSAVVIDNHLYIAVGNYVVCWALLDRRRVWAQEVDIATCFGIHWNAELGALICHGELHVSRLELDGTILWHHGGADIFTGALRLDARYVEVVDFNDQHYRFDYMGVRVHCSTIE